MVNFSSGFKTLKTDFENHGISIEKPGFYDDPNFIMIESNNPSYLINYTAFVAKQSYSNEYLKHARSVITKASTILYKILKNHGRQGACVDIASILSRILEKESIWNCALKGSLKISFPAESKEEDTFFWSKDQGNFTAAHSWLYAPPFSIVDIVVKQQPYSGKKKAYLPNHIIVEKGTETFAEPRDHISPETRMALAQQGVPKDQLLSCISLEYKDIISIFPAQFVQASTGSQLKYCPVAIHAPDLPFEEMRNMDFDGKTPFELYETEFKGKL